MSVETNLMAMPLDDSQLLRLASDPRTRLFPPLRGATVFGPLVVLTGLIPCLAAVLAGELGDTSAGWALRAIDVTVADEIQDWLEPGRSGLANAFVHQPPLSSWLMAMIVPGLGSDRVLSWRVLSLALESCAVWATYLLGRRLGGASFGLAATALICGHPVMLRVATGTSPAALGIFLIVIAAWGFLGHLEGPPQLVSLRMLAGSVAWGLALLAVGPVAVALFLPLLFHAWLLQEGRYHTPGESMRARLWQLWLGMRTMVVFVLTSLSFSGWWHLLMIGSYGGDFWLSWWSGQVILNSPQESVQSFWREWLSQNALVVSWLVIGLLSVFREISNPSSEIARRRCQFVLIWWLTALLARAVFDIPDLRRSVLIDAWDALLLLPTALLVAWGLRAMVMRQTNPLTEIAVVSVTLGLGLWRYTGHAWVGAAGFLTGGLLLLLLPMMNLYLRRGARRWTQGDWKRLMGFAVVSILTIHIVSGLLRFPPPTHESRSLTELRKRIATISAAPRVTLLTSNGLAPEPLLFVLRSHWPRSQFVVSGSREGRASRETAATSPSNELVIEWTRQEIRIANELPTDRQAVAIGDPLRFRGRRLTIYDVGPRQR